jgi:hypothetical protein
MSRSTPKTRPPWWNNGEIHIRSYTQPGEDFIKGKIKWKSKIVTCPHCNKQGGETAMKQHHFKNCKLKKASNE